MEEKIKNLILSALKNLDIEESNFVIEHPEDLKNGDYSTNVAMVCAKNLKTNPKDLALKIVAALRQAQGEFRDIQKIEAVGGFINFYLSQEFFTNSIKEILDNKEFGRNDLLKGKKIMVEYTQPNPFKPFHVGHLMSNTIGESISRMVEFSGAQTVRANYQGDVGLHVAKAIYGLQKFGMPESSKSVAVQAKYIGECYSKGSNLYDTDENVKKKIDEINKKVYDKSDAEINKIYDWGRKLTLEAFEEIYKTLGTKFNDYFFESDMALEGMKIVAKNTGKIFEESDGAIVFKGEKYDSKLHTRVFITKTGLPTYETKELGLTTKKFQKENPILSIVITAHEQEEYMKVVKQALLLIDEHIANRMKHIVHGMMRLASGKMSSRKGNVITGESLIEDSRAEIAEKIKDRDFNEEEKKTIASDVGVAALKYSILKQSIGGDIVYDFEKSISFEGDSGPYLQYSYARAKSVLRNAEKENIKASLENLPAEVTETEKLLYRFPEVVLYSAEKFESHHIANYLIELARVYNSFYGNTKIVDKNDVTSSYKLALTSAFATVMQNGLWLLGIKVPEKM